jgi:hypothetical protein
MNLQSESADIGTDTPPPRPRPRAHRRAAAIAILIACPSSIPSAIIAFAISIAFMRTSAPKLRIAGG